MDNYEEPQVVRRNNNKKKADKRKMRDGKALSRIQFQQVACTIILHWSISAINELAQGQQLSLNNIN